MHNAIKNIFYATIFLFIPCTFSFSSESDLIFTYAKKLDDNNCPKEAALEYKRYLFFEENSLNKNVLYSYDFLSNYYKKNDDLDHALLFARKASNTAQKLNLSDKEKNPYFKNEIQLLSKQQKDTNTQTILFAYTFDLYSYDINKAAWCALIKSNLKEQNFDQAQAYYSIAMQKNIFTTEEKEQIEKSFEELFNYSPKNPKIALGLSFIPGLGQIYAHEYKEGINAFLLNGGLIAAGVYSLTNAYYLDFFYFEFSPIFRFYRGNLYNAQRYTYMYNDRMFEEKLTKLYEILDLYN